MKIQYHCECLKCGGVTVHERDAKWSEKVPVVMLPFSVADNSWKCKGCGTVWAVDVNMVNVTEEFGEDCDGDMPLIEGQSEIGKMSAGSGGGLSIG